MTQGLIGRHTDHFLGLHMAKKKFGLGGEGEESEMEGGGGGGAEEREEEGDKAEKMGTIFRSCICLHYCML